MRSVENEEQSHHLWNASWKRQEGRTTCSQEADAANKQPVWWSHETPCHPRQVLGQMNVKPTRMVHNYMSPLYPAVYNPPGFPWRTFSSSIGVNISSSHTTSSFPSGTPSSVLVYFTRTIGSSRSVALRIVAAFLLPRDLAEKCEKNAMVAATIFPKKFRQPPHNIVVKHFDRRVVRRDENTGALVHSAK